MIPKLSDTNRPLLIGITGRAGSGKDTLSRIITHCLPFQARRIALADPLRAMLKPLGFKPADVYVRASKEQPLHDEMTGTRYEFSARQALQRLGTEGMRALDPDTWIKRLLDNVRVEQALGGLNRNRVIVIPDIRFANEAHAVVENGGLVIRLLRVGQKIADAGHVSEAGQDQVDPYVAITIGNDGSIRHLAEALIGELLGYSPRWLRNALDGFEPAMLPTGQERLSPRPEEGLVYQFERMNSNGEKLQFWAGEHARVDPLSAAVSDSTLTGHTRIGENTVIQESTVHDSRVDGGTYVSRSTLSGVRATNCSFNESTVSGPLQASYSRFEICTIEVQEQSIIRDSRLRQVMGRWPELQIAVANLRQDSVVMVVSVQVPDGHTGTASRAVTLTRRASGYRWTMRDRDSVGRGKLAVGYFPADMNFEAFMETTE